MSREKEGLMKTDVLKSIRETEEKYQEMIRDAQAERKKSLSDAEAELKTWSRRQRKMPGIIGISVLRMHEPKRRTGMQRSSRKVRRAQRR
ncbi:MAG: hypothetical protein RQM90_06160 [Methanoculleus sp.]